MFPELYHAHHNRHLEDLPFWLDLVAKVGDPVLELGCGTGRILIPMAQAGYRSFGLDHDLSMLKFLQANISPYIQNVPKIYAADICAFNLAAQFPLIILPCNTYSMLNDDQRSACLCCVRKHLLKMGVFAVSMPNPQLFANLPNQSSPELENEFFHPVTGNPVQVSSSWQRKKNTFNLAWIYDQIFPDGTIDRTVVNTVQQIVPLKTYEDEIESVGLKVDQVFGDFDQSTFTKDSTDLILLIRHRSC
jgi:SAM-dependent methyltransferase